RHQDRLRCAQQLQISKEISFALTSADHRRAAFAKARQEKWAAQRAAKDVLYKLSSAAAVEIIFVFVSIQKRAAIQLEKRAVKFIGAGTRDQRNLRAARTTQFSCEVAGHNLKLLN